MKKPTCIALHGGREITTRTPDEILAEWHSVCEEAKANGWSAEYGLRLASLQTEHAKALKERGLISIQGWPLTPYVFEQAIELLHREAEEAQTDLGLRKNRLLWEINQAFERATFARIMGHWPQAELAYRAMAKLRADLKEVQTELDIRWAARNSLDHSAAGTRLD